MHAVVFGSSGFLGSAIVHHLENNGWDVTRMSHSATENVDSNGNVWAESLKILPRVDGIVWAQGLNSKGTVLESDEGELKRLFEANVLFISRTLKALFEAKLLSSQSRGVVLSSIWQDVARQSKFEYTVTKAALTGLVNSITVDMASHGFTINSVLPGVVDSPMTRSNLSHAAVEDFTKATPGGKLITEFEVASIVKFLLSPESSGISGQAINIDRGWSKARYVTD